MEVEICIGIPGRRYILPGSKRYGFPHPSILCPCIELPIDKGLFRDNNGWPTPVRDRARAPLVEIVNEVFVGLELCILETIPHWS